MSRETINTKNREKVLPLGRILKVFLLAFVLSPLLTYAQTFESNSVAKTVVVSDPEVSYGDIILYDSGTNLYRVSNGENDSRFYGVAVRDPALAVEIDSGAITVIEGGLVPVNVTLENGEIAVGDPIITSSSTGKGMKGLQEEDSSSHMYVFGFAVEPLTTADAVATENSEHPMGTILVEVGGERLRAYMELLSGGTGLNESGEGEGGVSSNIGTVMRFGFASSVALGAIFLIFFAFLSSIKQGVISVGRNPRAESSIRSMIVLNVVLAILITAAAIFFAIALLVIES